MDVSCSFLFSRQEAVSVQVPAETEPQETEAPEKSEEPEETVPKATESSQKQGSDNAAEQTEPASDRTTEPTEETAAPVMIRDFEEDWLYAMEEPTEETYPSPVLEEPTAEGGNTVADLDWRFLLAGGIVFLFGIGLLLLGYITGRKY